MLVNNKHYTSIWINEEDTVQIIDQTRLPYHFEIIDLTSLDACCYAISAMQVRGAGLIGVTAACGVYVAAKEAPMGFEAFQDFMQEASAKLLSTRPTAKNLSWALDRQSTIWKNRSKEEALPLIRQEALAILEEDIAFCKSIGKHGAEIIKKIAQEKQGQTVNILTHCNAGWLAFADYGSALSPIYMAEEMGIKVHVWVDETRPRNQGASLTAWELGQHGISHNLIADNTGGHLMQHGLVDMCIVGADRVSRCGDVANKIGTYLKALAAADNNIPFYVAVPTSTFDFEICDGVRDIPIEERSGVEVESLMGLLCDENAQAISDIAQNFRICPPNTKARNWAFDVTPARLVTALITDKGVCPVKEEDIVKMLK